MKVWPGSSRFHQTRSSVRTLAVAMLLWWDSDALAAGTLTGSVSPVTTGSNVDLTIAGKSDWIHWGLYTATSLNRKSGVASQISDFSVIGTGVVDVYQYSNNYNGYTWHDGWPTVSITNTTNGVWAYQAYPVNLTGGGFQITTPADSTQRVLQVFVGAFAARGKFHATLSDASASPYLDTSLFNASNGPGAVYTLTYAANTNGQNLSVQWTLDQRAPGPDSTTANVTLQAATLTEAGADNPPFVTLTSPVDQGAFAAPAEITLNASAQDFDGTVTNVAFYAGANKLGQSADSPYSFTWVGAPIGHYFLTALATDDGGASRSSVPVEIFVYGGGGRLDGSVAGPPQAVDLTAEGTADWAHWGLATNTSFDYKKLVPRQISNFTPLGTNAVQRYADNFTSFSWADGTPTLSTNGTTTGVFITGITNGFTLTAPADTNSRTLQVYVGGYGAQAIFESYLSDLSAPPYTDTSVSSTYDNDYALYTLSYAAASAGQKLRVIYHVLTLFDYDFGNVTLQAAALQGTIPTVSLPVHLTNALFQGSDFVFSFPTETSFSYAIQSADSLPSTNWTTLSVLSGTGATVTVTNQNTGAGQRYYRVQTQ